MISFFAFIHLRDVVEAQNIFSDAISYSEGATLVIKSMGLY